MQVYRSTRSYRAVEDTKSMHRRYQRVVVIVGLLMMQVFLVACSNGPPPRLYLLDPAFVRGSLQEDPGQVAGLSITALGMSPVILPGYASDPPLASVSEEGIVSLDDGHRWAEEPADAISRVLAERLRLRSGATVLIEPWPRDFQPSARVEIVFDRLLREPLGGADMAGQILLLSGDGRRLLKALPFQFTHYGRSTDKRVFFAAVSQGIDDLALMAVRALQELKVRS